MKTPADVVAALCLMNAAIDNLAAAWAAHERGELDIEVDFVWLACGVDQFGNAWEHYLRTYDAAQQAALSQGGFDAVNNLTDHLGLHLVALALHERMLAAGLGPLMVFARSDAAAVQRADVAADRFPQPIGSDTVQ